MLQAVKAIPFQRLNDIVAVLDHGITAKSIASSISSSAPESNRKVGEVRAFMKQSGFDRVAIAQSAHIIGYVDIEHLNDCKTGDPIGVHARPFEPRLLVSDETPLPVVLRRMKDQPAVFLVGSDGIDGIITHADLEKQCMRVYLFGLVSLLEQELCKTMEELSCQAVLDAIYNSSARDRFERDFNQKRTAGDELAPIYYATLGTKRDLILADDKYWKSMGSIRRVVAEKLASVLDLRNALDHVNLLSGSILSWSSLCEAVENVTGIIESLEMAAQPVTVAVDASV